MKCKYPYLRCRKFGHLKNDHSINGVFKPGTTCLDQPPTDSDSEGLNHANANGGPHANPNKKPNVALGSTSALFTSSLVANVAQSAKADFRKVGPLVDDALRTAPSAKWKFI